MNESIFTKIINGTIPSHCVYEDEDVFAFLDIHPITKGHTLVVPKKQVEFLWDLDDEAYTRVNTVAKRIALHLRNELNVPYIGEQVIGVDVPHAHIHLIPFTNAVEFHQKPSEDEPDHIALAELANLIRIQ